MAIIKHKTSRNARYDDVLEYYSYKHAEDDKTGHYEPILDTNGLMQPRENCAVIYVASDGNERDPYLWAGSCQKTNYLYRKNKNRDDRKSHEYIISHPAADREKLTIDDLLDEGRAFAHEFLACYDVLIAVHRDTDNDHIHISIGSVRPQAREKQAWMSCDDGGNILACELAAGGKHQDTPKLRAAMSDWLLEYTRSHGLEAKDNNAIAAQRRQQRYAAKNAEMRDAVLNAASISHDMSELGFVLQKEYGIILKVSSTGNTISVLYPGNAKYVRLRTLGISEEELRARFGNAPCAAANAQDDEAENWEVYREAGDNEWKIFSAAQKESYKLIRDYRGFKEQLYYDNSSFVGPGKKRKLNNWRRLQASGFFEDMENCNKVIEDEKAKIDLRKKYQAIVKGRKKILQSLIAAGADSKTIAEARNECHEAMTFVMRYVSEPSEDFQGRRLKVAQWSLEQAETRASEYIRKMSIEKKARAYNSAPDKTRHEGRNDR